MVKKQELFSPLTVSVLYNYFGVVGEAMGEILINCKIHENTNSTI